MKNRNTIIFFGMIGALLILFAITAPITSILVTAFILLIGFTLILFALYTFVITQFRGKSAFTIIEGQPIEKTLIHKPPFEHTFQPTPIKRT